MTFTATADMPLRQGWLRLKGSQPGGLAAHPLDILSQACLGVSRLRTPVSRGISAVSSRTIVNNAGYRAQWLAGGDVQRNDLFPNYVRRASGNGLWYRERPSEGGDSQAQRCGRLEDEYGVPGLELLQQASEKLFSTPEIVTDSEVSNGSAQPGRMLKKAVQQGRSEVHGAKNNERQACARRRVGEPAVS
jgi:hypothetical protein